MALATSLGARWRLPSCALLPMSKSYRVQWRDIEVAHRGADRVRPCGGPDLGVCALRSGWPADASSPSTATAHICRRRFLESAFEALTRSTTWLSDRRTMAATIWSARRPSIQLFSTAMGWERRARLTACWRARVRCSFPLASPIPSTTSTWQSDLSRLPRNCGSLRRRAPRTAAWLEEWGQAVAAVADKRGRPVKLTPSAQAVRARRHPACGADDLLAQVRQRR